MKRISLVIFFSTLLPVVLKGSELRGEPSWFPLGAAVRVADPDIIINCDNSSYDMLTAEVYQEGDRFKVQSNVLSIVREPRWFRSAIAPMNIQDVQLSDQGASLFLAINSDTNGFFRVTLRVDAKNRDLWREIEHRWTDITPFLFAFFVDEKPIQLAPRDSAKFGGANSMSRLAPKGGVYALDLAIDPSSINALIPGTNSSELVVIAAFGEYQHLPPSLARLFAERPSFPRDYSGPPIIVRSNEVRLRRKGASWIIIHE